jgi:hypothetical protein
VCFNGACCCSPLYEQNIDVTMCYAEVPAGDNEDAHAARLKVRHMLDGLIHHGYGL